jgi:phage gpG-like protein
VNITFKGSAQLFNENWWASSKMPIADILQQDNEESWSRERDPQTGQGWMARKTPTGTWPILRKTGTMQDRVKIKPVGVGLFATKTTNYGPFHMSGTSRMTARPWLGVPAMSMPKITVSVKKAIVKGKTLRF